MLIIELHFDAVLYSNVGNENSDAGHITCLRGLQVPYPCSKARSRLAYNATLRQEIQLEKNVLTWTTNWNLRYLDDWLMSSLLYYTREHWSLSTVQVYVVWTTAKSQHNRTRITWPARWSIFSSLSMSAGSAGTSTSTVRVSTATTPTGTPPKRARPTTTVFAQPWRISSNESWSKKPWSHSSVSAMNNTYWAAWRVLAIVLLYKSGLLNNSFPQFGDYLFYFVYSVSTRQLCQLFESLSSSRSCFCLNVVTKNPHLPGWVVPASIWRGS